MKYSEKTLTSKLKFKVYFIIETEGDKKKTNSSLVTLDFLQFPKSTKPFETLFPLCLFSQLSFPLISASSNISALRQEQGWGERKKNDQLCWKDYEQPFSTQVSPEKNHFLLAHILFCAVRSPDILKKAEKENNRERPINIPDHTVFSKRCLLKLS